jgi:hypothetical protein
MLDEHMAYTSLVVLWCWQARQSMQVIRSARDVSKPRRLADTGLQAGAGVAWLLLK